MATDTRQRHKPAPPLAVQVTQAERGLLNRHKMVGYRASVLRDDLRKQLSSPAMLLIAGGLGLIGGYIKGRASSPDDNDGARRSKLMPVALDLVSMAAALFRRQASGATESSPWSGWPRQAPETVGSAPLVARCPK
jgi:hypothetical protein